MKSSLEETLLLLIKADNLPQPEREYRFHPTRKWRFDFAYPERKIGIECEGGTWAKSRHTTGSGYRGDCEKYNAASILGWRVLRFTRDMIESGEAIETIRQVLEE
jgi:very-short-patch-repair endonuclease